MENKGKFYFLGHYWDVKSVPADELPGTALAVADWVKLTIRINNSLAPSILEEVLIHEVIELSVLDMRIVDRIKVGMASTNEDADYIAECLDSVVISTLLRNPDWFPIIRGVSEA